MVGYSKKHFLCLSHRYREDITLSSVLYRYMIRSAYIRLVYIACSYSIPKEHDGLIQSPLYRYFTLTVLSNLRGGVVGQAANPGHT